MPVLSVFLMYDSVSAQFSHYTLSTFSLSFLWPKPENNVQPQIVTDFLLSAAKSSLSAADFHMGHHSNILDLSLFTHESWAQLRQLKLQS